MNVKSISLLAIGMLAATTCLMTGGCKKSNSSSPTSQLQFTATVGDSAFKATSTVSSLYYPGENRFILGGVYSPQPGDTTWIGVIFLNTFKLNVPINSDTSFVDIDYYNALTFTEWDAAQGGIGNATVTVTAWDSSTHTISGIFSGMMFNDNNLSDSIAVTNGQFNVDYTEVP
jgi:hypothetical protein